MVKDQVATIIKAVATDGDTALIRLSNTIDHTNYIDPKDFVVSPETLKGSYEAMDATLKKALAHGIASIQAFHTRQREAVEHLSFSVKSPSKILSMRTSPLERACVYVPGGLAAYPSSVLMNVIPAQIAGVKSIALFTPPSKNTDQTQGVYAACYMLGITEVYAIGGPMAIAAAALGTQTIPPAHIVTGPGNQYVTEAKRQLVGTVKIDMLAGPSELMIVADASANPHFIAADLLAQAEHDPQAKLHLVLLAPDPQPGPTTWIQSSSSSPSDPSSPRTNPLYQPIAKAITDQLKIDNLSPAALALENLSLVTVKSEREAAQEANKIAPEHLSLQYENPEIHAYKNAGSIFVGSYSPQALGDYCCGTNHILPTAGTAKFDSGLSVLTFLKQTQIIQYEKDDLQNEPTGVKDLWASIQIASREGLNYHKKSLEIRRKCHATSSQ